MTDTQQKDKATYSVAAATLRTGMLASLASMLVGLVWWLLIGSPGGDAAASHVLPLTTLLPQLVALNPLALLNIGVLLLLVTPAVTLLSQIVTFSIDGNRRFAAITALVVAIILTSLLASFGWLRLP